MCGEKTSSEEQTNDFVKMKSEIESIQFDSRWKKTLKSDK